MTTWELVLWSACLGVFTLALLVSVGIALAQRSMAWLQAAGFNVLCMLFVAATSGWLATMWPSLSPKELHTLQIVSGAIMGSGAMLGLMELLRKEA